VIDDTTDGAPPDRTAPDPAAAAGAPDPADVPAEPAERAHAPAAEAPEAAAQRVEVRAHLATPDELADWDAHAVASKRGHVYQSRAWGDYRTSRGWQAWHIAFDDGFRLLAVGRERAVVGGGGAYATRGPIPEDDPALSAARAAAAAELLADQGMDAFTVDGETPASSGLHAHLEARGFELTEELQPSRHRMDVRLGPVDTPNSDESTIFASFGATTRNLIRQAERRGLRVQRLDAGGGRSDEDTIGLPLEGFDPVDLADAATTDEMLRTFYGMLDATAHRRGFALASEGAFTDWSTRSLAAGHMLYLQARDEGDGPVAGASFYRHGDRLTYSLAGDRAELRKKHPGAVRLLVWRGIQIALDERRAIVDLGGIDTEGAREQPNKGDPTYGMYQFKEAFGARWVELTGAHKRTMRPMRNLAGRVIGKLAALRR
jgi:lipid II:glycine glycyltransferase (peptidoglycan interpeptide bridge formation enzyme)